MIKSFLTKGILNDGQITITKNYELPLDLEIDYSEQEINMELQRPIEIEIETLGGGVIIKMNIINLKQNEQKIIRFNVTDAITKEIIPLTDCTFYLKMQLQKDDKIVEKQDSDFDKTEILKGIIKITLEPGDLDTPGRYSGQLKIIFPNGEIDKSDIFSISVSEAIA